VRKRVLREARRPAHPPGACSLDGAGGPGGAISLHAATLSSAGAERFCRPQHVDRECRGAKVPGEGLSDVLLGADRRSCAACSATEAAFEGAARAGSLSRRWLRRRLLRRRACGRGLHVHDYARHHDARRAGAHVVVFRGDTVPNEADFWKAPTRALLARASRRRSSARALRGVPRRAAPAFVWDARAPAQGRGAAGEAEVVVPLNAAPTSATDPPHSRATTPRLEVASGENGVAHRHRLDLLASAAHARGAGGAAA